MNKLQSRTALVLALGLVSVFGSAASALDPARPRKSNGEPGWSGPVLLFGEERDAVKSMPITQRPYRPLHFYGNTVRRMHYRGTAVPAPRDVFGAGKAVIAGE